MKIFERVTDFVDHYEPTANKHQQKRAEGVEA